MTKYLEAGAENYPEKAMFKIANSNGEVAETYSYKETEMAYERGHSTATMAAQIAVKASVNQLILTHLSPRYNPGNQTCPNDLLNEAKSIFPNTLLAKDFLQINLNKSDNCNSS